MTEIVGWVTAAAAVLAALGAWVAVLRRPQGTEGEAVEAMLDRQDNLERQLRADLQDTQRALRTEIAESMRGLRTGLTQSEALTRTKREFASSGRYRAPFYWAAFTLWGA